MLCLTLKCTKFNLGWGSAPDPTGRAYSALSDLLAGFKRSYFQKKWTEQKRKRKGRKGQWHRQVEGDLAPHPKSSRQNISIRLNHRCKNVSKKLKTVKNVKTYKNLQR